MISGPPAPRETDIYTASYDLLARFYLGGPRALRSDQLPGIDPLLGALGQVNPAWPLRVRELLARHDEPVELERAHHDYLQSFVLPIPGRYVPPYASVYLDNGTLWGDSTFKVLKLYETEGLAWQRTQQTGGICVTAPDHLGVELAFLALATTHRRHRGAELKRQQRLKWLLQDHISRWLRPYHHALVKAGAGPVLEGWTSWAIDLVQADHRRRRQTSESEIETQ